MRTTGNNERSVRPFLRPFVVPLFALVSLVGHPAWGRILVSGTVETAGNEPVAGAEITFTNENDPFEAYSDVTDDEGGYRIHLPIPTVIAEDETTPSSFQLHQNYPNPFNSSTVITYSLPAPGYARVEIYNNLGQRVRTLADAWQDPGSHSVTWDGLDDSGQGVAAGVYIYELTSGGSTETRKMVLNDGAAGPSAPGPAAGKTVVQQDLPTYRVSITGPGIVPFEQRGLVLQGDSVLDFTVQRKWQIGTPIVGYYHGPGGGGGRWGPLTHGMAQKLVDQGFTLAWGTTVEDLDVAHAHGLRLDLLEYGLREPSYLDDPGRRETMDSIIESVKDHPALYSYRIVDEPSAVRFPEFGRLVEYIRERDPAHLSHINLLPTYASAEALGTSGDLLEAYREHLRQFVDITKADLISYDHYNFRKDYDGNQYFTNLALVREAALYGGIPFINVIQAVSLNESFRIPTGDESRYLCYTTLAYGGQGIMHFTYWAYSEFRGGISEFEDIEWTEERAAADAAAPLTPLGEALSENHAEFIAVAEQLQPLTSLAVYHTGQKPAGGFVDELPADAAFAVDPPFTIGTTRKGLLWGFFGSADEDSPSGEDSPGGEVSHLLVVNLEHGKEITRTIVGPGVMEEFDPQARVWRPVSDGSRAEVSLVAGGGRLLRLQGGP